MPIIDVFAHLGSTPWFQADRAGLLRAMQRAGIQQTAVASRLALASNFAEGNFKLKAALDEAPVGAEQQEGGDGGTEATGRRGEGNVLSGRPVASVPPSPRPPLLGYVTVNPAYGEVSVQEMRRYLGARSFVGITLDPRASGQPLDSEASRSVVNSFRRYQKPLLVPVRGEEDVRALANLARDFATVKIIAAHAGGEAWATCLALAERQLNLFLEPFTGGAERHKVEESVTRIGAHRILFGTGFPVLNPGVALGMVADARLSEADKRLILGNNAARLFGLDAPREDVG